VVDTLKISDVTPEKIDDDENLIEDTTIQPVCNQHTTLTKTTMINN